ncbi:MAG: AAA family ATPase [Chloroflexi bacterium]|nr:AAA family ATPase [Chloroflexota bacterium]
MDAQAVARRIIDNVERVIIGKRQEVELAVMTLLCGGHLLIEDVPGVGKTMLARSLARSTGCIFKRIQFTPDLLPSDVTGVSIYNQKTNDFEFRPGPLLAQVILADEINRATPKTQSALLEAMEERQVTVDGVTYQVPQPFMVMATQNPIEYEGTFPLPEAQLDRFMVRIHLGYPSPQDEVAIMDHQREAHPVQSLEQVSGPEEVTALQAACLERVPVPGIRARRS